MNNRSLFERVQSAHKSFGKNTIETAPWHGKKTVIYGAGRFGRDVAEVLLRQNVPILGFLDRQGVGQIVTDDLRAQNLKSSEAERWAAENPAVIIGAFNGSASMKEISLKLTQNGFIHIITPMEAYLHISKELGWRYWLGTEEDYSAAGELIERASSLWADSQSERLFLETLLFRLERDLNVVSDITDARFQYADPALPRWKEPVRMIDGGAYTGDTLNSLARQGYRFAAIHAFEPDLLNFEGLRNEAACFSQPSEISLWPCGIGASTCRLNFTEGKGTSSRFSSSGESHASVVALDEVLHSQTVNFIKLDIEGAELDALRGAQRLIERNRPGLAICLYHFPYHLWSIPLWVFDLKLDYRLYYRIYEQNTFETVLYAFPS